MRLPVTEPTSAGLLESSSVMFVLPERWMASAEIDTTGLANAVSGRAMREPVTVTSIVGSASDDAGSGVVASCEKALGAASMNAAADTCSAA